MYDEAVPHSKKHSEVEAIGSLCPRCGFPLNERRVYVGYDLFCLNCGYAFGDEARGELFE